MVAIPAGKFRFKVSGVEIEGGDEPGVDVQYPWEEFPHRHHDHEMDIKPFDMDRFPVTHGEFKKFLDASYYRPKDNHNFLKDWVNGSYPAGWAKKPVTWVSLEDARAYAAWAGKRLPHEWEWQYAAQGLDGRPYPWGFEANPSAIPKPESGPQPRPATDVDAFAKGASPFGVHDLTGNVWQWTDEFTDAHTRGDRPRRRLLSARRFDVVLPPQLEPQRARKVPHDGALQRSFGDDRLSLRRRCAVVTPAAELFRSLSSLGSSASSTRPARSALTSSFENRPMSSF